VTTDLNEFIAEPFTALQLAQLGVPGYPSSKFRMSEYLYKEKVPRHSSQRRGGGYVYWFRDLPGKWQNDIIDHFNYQKRNEDGIRKEVSEKEIDAVLYAAAPEYNRKKADKYLALYNDYSHLKGSELKAAIAKHNREHQNKNTSYPRVKAVFKEYEQYGITAFLGKYGTNIKKTTVPDDAFTYWRNLIWIEGAPSYEFCWMQTVQQYCSTKEAIADFPTCAAFLRKLRANYTESEIHLARHGKKAWSQKYAYSIDRDVSNVKAGQIWVADHAQIDNLVSSHKSKAKREKVLAPWYTAWRDFKTSKHLGGILHEDSPNSDHILQSFYYAAMTHGLPEIVYIDNGKDFRAKDFTGGRKTKSVVKIETEKARNTMAALGIKVIFALPYNAQSKPIERDFRKVKEWFAKRLPGYRGGHVLERPEKLAKEIKTGNILTFDEYKPLFDRFIEEVLNCMPSKGKALNGLSPNDLWNRESPIKKIADKDSLKLCCMRTSKTMLIGRHGIRDAEFGVIYFDEWLWRHPRTEVYLRRDPKDFNEAYVFNAKTDAFMGKAFIKKQVAAFAETPIEKDQLKEAMAIKRRQIKREKEPGSTIIRQSTETILENMVETARLFGNNIEAQNQNVSELVRTPLDSVALEQRATKRAQHFKNDNEARILSATWAIDESGRKIKPILKLDSDFDYYEVHKDELQRIVNG
jgi:hypothetical protein